MGTSAAQAVSWLAEKEDFRHRLGEIRYGAIDGAWVKVFNKQNRVSDGYGFKQESTGIHLGLDRVISQSANGQWLVGAALRYAEADQEGLLVRRHLKIVQIRRQMLVQQAFRSSTSFNSF